jgi:1-acyl-sn-glycerol-3-phosphate acyltransferase
MSGPVFPPVPPHIPLLGPSAVAPLSRWIFERCGWRLAGEFPDVPKLVLIAAPHSTNWDVVWGLLVKVGLRLDVHFIGKREAFFWPLGPLLRGFGGIAIDRKHAQDVVGTMKREFDAHERFWLAIAPEGTRKKVDKWKSGFWRIAREAGVPILPVYFHYPQKILGLGPLFHPGEDFDADVERLRAFYRPWVGRNGKTV